MNVALLCEVQCDGTPPVVTRSLEVVDNLSEKRKRGQYSYFFPRSGEETLYLMVDRSWTKRTFHRDQCRTLGERPSQRVPLHDRIAHVACDLAYDSAQCLVRHGRQRWQTKIVDDGGRNI